MTSKTKQKPDAAVEGTQQVQITAPNFRLLVVPITGTAPYVQNRFSSRAFDKMRTAQVVGSVGKKGKKREPRDFDADFQAASHRMEPGTYGIPASSFRNGMISACRLVGFKMTLAKLAVFVEADGYDSDDGTPLVQIIGEPPIKTEMAVRNADGGTDIRARPMWKQWAAVVRVRYDADLFSEQDVANLMERVGQQVGIGAGRPDSHASAGLGWGLFTTQSAKATEAA